MKRRFVLGCWVTLAMTLTAAAASRLSHTVNPELPVPGPGVLRPVAVRDLPYGDALYYFYLGDYETALERLQFAESKGRLPHHRDDAKLLMGGIELTLGDYAQAARLFADVLDQPNVPDNVHDRAHFYLGKMWYRRGYYTEAIDSLSAANRGTLPPDFDGERRMLLAEALIESHRDGEAVAILEHWEGASLWRTYAEFNLGVALVRAGKVDTGIQVLDALGRRTTDGAEALTLRDQANVALGYALVQQHRPAEAISALARVRATGAYATKALLGAGWAAADAGNFKEALAPWLELRSRGAGDPAVQESYLAVPFAYARLGAEAQAVEAYELALSEFEGELAQLDDAIALIRSGGLAAAIEGMDRAAGSPIAVEIQKVPANRYLYQLLARDDFQAALTNWRDLAAVSKRLDLRNNDVDAFAELIDYRRQRFENQLPKDLAALDRKDIDRLVRRRTDLEARVAEADTHADLAALGTPRQRAIWNELERMESIIDRAGDIEDPEIDEMADRVDFLKGYLYWELSDGFKSRVWTAKKRLRDVNHLLHESTRSATLIKEARERVPNENSLLERRLNELRPRIAAIHDRSQELRDREMGALAEMATSELQREKSRIRDYVLEARYSLATLYDRAVASPSTKKDSAQ